MTKELAGKTAIVTGASSGIGLATATQLAERGANVVLVARREKELETLAEKLRTHNVKVTVLAVDLSDATAAQTVFDKTEGSGIAVDILINNAGFGTHQYFVDMPWEQTARQLQLNVVTLTELCRRFAEPMKKRGEGYILNVASIGAYLPCPTYATYAAGKAYVRDFSEAIAYELAPFGVRVCCLCPGGTTTEFHQVSGQAVPSWQRPAFMSAERCARIGLDSLFGGRRNVVSGYANSLGMWFLRFIPRRVMVWLGAVMMGPPATKALPAPAK